MTFGHHFEEVIGNRGKGLCTNHEGSGDPKEQVETDRMVAPGEEEIIRKH